MWKTRENKRERRTAYLYGDVTLSRGGRRRIRCTESNFTVIYLNNNANYKPIKSTCLFTFYYVNAFYDFPIQSLYMVSNN